MALFKGSNDVNKHQMKDSSFWENLVHYRFLEFVSCLQARLYMLDNPHLHQRCICVHSHAQDASRQVRQLLHDLIHVIINGIR